MNQILRPILLFVAALWPANAAMAQWNPQGSTQSYSDIYTNQLAQSGQTLNPRTYLWDRYYYNNPNVSPYLNLMRLQPYGGTDYFTYVQPQEQARQAEASVTAGGPGAGGQFSAGGGTGMIQPRNPFSSSPDVATSEFMPSSGDAPSRNSSFYYNHWYGGWEGRN